MISSRLVTPSTRRFCLRHWRTWTLSWRSSVKVIVETSKTDLLRHHPFILNSMFCGSAFAAFAFWAGLYQSVNALCPNGSLRPVWGWTSTSTRRAQESTTNQRLRLRSFIGPLIIRSPLLQFWNQIIDSNRAHGIGGSALGSFTKKFMFQSR